ncbi:MAG TPA: hypothetical protein VKL22_07495, partial [Actinomycetota bacterium]|nr:hypothetical protein [Actinomycetota bacterium]
SKPRSERTGGAGLRRLADGAMVQAANFRKLHDPPGLRRFDEPEVRCILVEREMRASPMIVRE